MSVLETPASAPELRRAFPTDGELRLVRSGEAGNTTVTFAGHAAVFDQLTTLYEGRYWVYREKIAAGAFSRVLAEIASGAAEWPVVFNREHDNRYAMASTNRSAQRAGGLELSQDTRGLLAFARLDAEDPEVQSLARAMELDIVRQMSFRFTVSGEEILTEIDDRDREITTRTVTEVGLLLDVTAVVQGAYPTTDASIRSLAAAYDRPREDRTQVERPGAGHQDDVAPLGAGAVDRTVAPLQVGGAATQSQLEAARLRVARLRHR